MGRYEMRASAYAGATSLGNAQVGATLSAMASAARPP